MARLVVELQQRPGARSLPTVYLRDAPRKVVGDDPRPFRCPQEAEPFKSLRDGILTPSMVQAAGRLLYTQLGKNSAVRTALRAAVDDNTPAPIYFNLLADRVEELPWEALCDPRSGFLALRTGWQIGRMAGPDIRDLFKPVKRAFEPPLKVLVVLSAVNVPAQGEWDALYGAFHSARAKVPFSMRVLVAEADLEKQIRLLNDPQIHVDFVPERAEALFETMRSFAPHLVHFFCHGSTVGGAHLELASRGQWIPGASDVTVEPQGLGEGSRIQNVNWLITLNACDTAGAGSRADVSSLARDLVTKGGFPAVVGMREPIASDDAHVFTGAFYTAVLDEIAPCLKGKRRTLHWARALYGPRYSLCNQHSDGRVVSDAASELWEWTLPVLYVGPGEFRVRRRAVDETLSEEQRRLLQAELTTLQQYRDAFVAAGAPAELLAKADEQIEILRTRLYRPSDAPAP